MITSTYTDVYTVYTDKYIIKFDAKLDEVTEDSDIFVADILSVSTLDNKLCHEVGEEEFMMLQTHCDHILMLDLDACYE